MGFRRQLMTLLTLAMALVAGCADEPPMSIDQSADSPQLISTAPQFTPVRLNSENLPNLLRVHPKVYSGGLPEGEAAFAELAGRGVRTIISVDGMRPDVKTAAKHRLTYIHLPHGYDGIPAHRVKELAKAVQELDGPIYIHCHHGKHRSPVAAGVACVSAGLVPAEAAVELLHLAGTSRHYRGLFESVANAHPLDQTLLESLHVDYREVQEIPPMAEAMVQLNEVYHRVQLLAEAGWGPVANHADLDAAHEVLLLREHFTELLRTGEARQRGGDFQRWLIESEAAARDLESVLRSSDARTGKGVNQLQRISNACKQCHTKHRDVPLSEKSQ